MKRIFAAQKIIIPIAFAVALFNGALTAEAVAENATPTAQFVASQTRANVGVGRIVVVELPAVAEADAEWELSASPAEGVEILRPLRVRAGHRLAFARIRPLTAGALTLSVEALDIQCRVICAEWPDRDAPVALLTPKPGAVVWGECVVGGQFSGERPSIARLIVNTGVAVEVPGEQLEWLDGVWQLNFPVNAQKLTPGRTTLVVELAFSDGTTRQSDAVMVTVAHPTADELIVREAEELAALPLPEDYRPQRQPSTAADRRASGGRYVVHNGSDPPTRIPVPGGQWYQMAVVSRGQYAAGGWPTVGIWLDNDRNTLHGHSPTVSAEWHRVIVGQPVWVPEGEERRLAARFMNDTFLSRVYDRNWHLDRVELLVVPQWSENAANDVGVTLLTPLDGQTVPGALYLDAVLVRRNRNIAPPAVWLELNGERIDVQHSDRPRFRVGTDVMQRGENRLRLIADLAPAMDALTPEHRFFWPGNDAEPAGSRDGWHRITASHPGWEGIGVADRRFTRNAPDGHAFNFFSNRDVAITLPEALSGDFEFYLYAHGDRFEGDPIARVKLNGAVVGERPCPPGWRSVSFGRITLPSADTAADGHPTANRLEVAFINDHFRANVGDRNLFIGALEFRPVVTDTTPPAVGWHYPPAGAKIGRADAVVVDVADASGILDVTVFCNDTAIPGATAAMSNAVDGRVCIPFALRHLPAGEVTLRVDVRDRFRRLTRTTPVTVTLVDDAATTATAFARAAHFLNRFGYGPEPRLLAEVLLDGPETCLRRWLTAGSDAVTVQHVNTRYPNLESVGQTFVRLLEWSLRSPNPVRQRLVHFWEDHFSTWIQKTGARRKWAEVTTIERLAHRPFSELLRASAQSPAMLVYLDQNRSFGNRLNENYAREIMELHTLGVSGGYSQADVEALARVLTGWSTTFTDMIDIYTFIPALHDGSQQEVVGFVFDAVPARADADTRFRAARDRGETALELLLAHPATARFVATKLVEHYVAVPAPPAILDAVTASFLKTAGDPVEMLVAIATHEEFYADTATPFAKGTDPLEFALRFSRCGESINAGLLRDLLGATERLPMDRVTPDGYPEADENWFDSSSMLQRWRFAEGMATAIRGRLFLGASRGNVPFDEAWNQALIDHLAVRFTGRLLSDKSNAMAMRVLQAASGDHNQRVALAITIIGQLPEAQLH